MLETDSIISSISGVWETMIFVEVDWNWWIRKKGFSSQLKGKNRVQEMWNVTSSSLQKLSSTSSTESLRVWLINKMNIIHHNLMPILLYEIMKHACKCKDLISQVMLGNSGVMMSNEAKVWNLQPVKKIALSATLMAWKENHSRW